MSISVHPSVARTVWIMVGICTVAILIGLVVLWPKGDVPNLPGDPFESGIVTEMVPCEGEAEPGTCNTVTIELTSGDSAGESFTTDVIVHPGSPQVEPGVKVFVTSGPDENGDPVWALADLDRTKQVWLLAALVAVAVIGLARWKGVMALLGLGASLVMLGVFILPAIIIGTDPVPVAAVGAGAIALLSMGLAHGPKVGTGIALLATFAALALTTILGWAFTESMHLTGMLDEEARYLAQVTGNLDLGGLVLAGLVIGAMGVLDDVTVTQVAAVNELHAAQPSLPFRRLASAGMRIGRDHIAAVVNTLVLAYAGASLPLFVLIAMSNLPLAQSLNNEEVAVEIVRSGVGALGVIAAVPIATVITAWALRGAHEREAANSSAGAS